MANVDLVLGAVTCSGKLSLVMEYAEQAVDGEPLPAFDTTLFIVNALVVSLASVIVAVATKGQLGYGTDARE